MYEGDFSLITGPSGSGKSTLLNLIGMLDNPTDGKIMIDRLDVSMLSDKEKTRLRNEKVGFVFQFFNLIPELTVLENVMLPQLIQGANGHMVKEKATRLLHAVGLADQLHKGATQLSGGQMQRVSIARALMNQPTIVLADEPTGNLDSKNAAEIVRLMHEMNKMNQQTFIIVSHDPSIFGRVDRTVYIRDGLVEKITD